MKLPHPLRLGAGLGRPLRLAQPSCKDASCSWTWMLARWTANSRCLARHSIGQVLWIGRMGSGGQGQP
jgi:hypothetical protein